MTPIMNTSDDTFKEEPYLVLDLYVLSQAIKTGVYRVCDEVFPRIIANAAVPVAYLIRPGFEEGARKYLKEKKLPENLPIFEPSSKNVPKGSLLVSPFGVAPKEWLDMEEIKHAHFIYDLIAINNPEFFTSEGASEVRSIVASLRSDTTVFAISHYTKSELLTYRSDLSDGQVNVVPLAASDKFSYCVSQKRRENVRSKYGIPNKVPYLLSLATLEIRKNMEQVIRSYVCFMNQQPDSELHLVLSGMVGWKKEKVEAALAEAGPWRNRIITTGYVDDGDLSALYSDALCFLYLSRAEGFGLPPLEAMACGTPVITSNNSSLPEVVGDAGWMFDAEDTRGVAQRIAELLFSPQIRSEYSHKGLERASVFSWENCAATILNTLQERLSEGVSSESKAGAFDIDAKLASVASFYGYKNGASGPRFSLEQGEDDECVSLPAWPKWKNASTRYPGVIEGGKRIKGAVKSTSPGFPLVTYVTVVRNNEKTVERAIRSVQSQTYPNVEHIVVDGASTDRTLEIVKNYSERIDYFLSEPDNGLYDALNKAIPLARGDLICVLNSDDWLQPDAAAVAARHMANCTRDNAILLTAANVVSTGGAAVSFWPPAFLHPGSLFLCPNVCHNGIYATRKVYECSGAYDDSYKIAADSKWILQSINSGAHVIYTAEATINYSLGGISADSDKHGVECIRIIMEAFPFLESSEAERLYYCFNIFAKDKAKRLHVSWSDFMRRMFVKYSERTDFLLALSWAGVPNMEHHYDIVDRNSAEVGVVGTIQRLRANHRLFSFLLRHPVLFDAARAFYRRFIKK